jgi:1-acyl-sn-glycerol-3-phosphate acyltransferase
MQTTSHSGQLTQPGGSLLAGSRDRTTQPPGIGLPRSVRTPDARNIPGRAARLWRQVRLACAFVLFGIATLTVAFIAAPVLRRTARRSGIGREEAAQLAVQRAIGRACAFSIGCCKVFGILRVDAQGIRELAGEPACIVVANHPTLLDVVLLGSYLPQMDCIVNAGWTANSPFLARAIDVAGYHRNDGGIAVVETCATQLRRGRRLLVFPEGTRSPWGRFGKFHRGAAHIALASGAPIVAVSIDCRPRMLGSAQKWHDVADRMSQIRVRVAGRLDPADYAGARNTAIAARRMTDDLSQIFAKIFSEERNIADA